MAIWAGGACPNCGEDMPQAIIRCRVCRTLLNTDLEISSVEIPEFIPLPELETMPDIQPLGIYLECDKCRKELKIALKYLGERVACKFCGVEFRLDAASPEVQRSDVYSKCVHCQKELRFDPKYIGHKVGCRFCGGKLQIQPMK